MIVVYSKSEKKFFQRMEILPSQDRNKKLSQAARMTPYLDDAWDFNYPMSAIGFVAGWKKLLPQDAQPRLISTKV